MGSSTFLIIAGILLLIYLIYRTVFVAKGDEILIPERRWFGASMSEDQTIAMSYEVGIQARVLGPGLHFLAPFLYKVYREKFVKINKGEIGLVTALSGKQLAPGQIFGDAVNCKSFADGDLFLYNDGNKGPQLPILSEGHYKINPYLFKIEVVKAITIGENEVGIVDAVFGNQVDAGCLFAKPVYCNDYQDAELFISNGGQRGLQLSMLEPGTYRINTLLFNIKVDKVTIVENGKIGLVLAMDGCPLPSRRLLGKKISGHNNFSDGVAFLEAGGEKGRQLEFLHPGKYRINTALFKVDTSQGFTTIGADEIGIVTINEGLPIADQNRVVARELPLDSHDSFQDATAYIDQRGEKGLQIPVLSAGVYAINPWFASVEVVSVTLIETGKMGKVKSYYEDLYSSSRLWEKTLAPGKYPINTRIYRVEIINKIVFSFPEGLTGAEWSDVVDKVNKILNPVGKKVTEMIISD